MLLPSTRQQAYAFNKPLSFDTSKVTDMGRMFYVRSARALAPNSLESGVPRARPLAPVPPHALPPPGPHLAPYRMLLPSTRQTANAFNQPLSFDTSKVTNMNQMFYVRSARALTPKPWVQSDLPPCMPLAPPPPHALPPPGAHIAPHRMPLPLNRQIATAFDQPLSFDTSKVTDMGRMFYVRSARALAPNSLESGVPRARPLAPVPPHALPPPGPHLAPYRMLLPSTRQMANAFNQPLSFDTSKVMNMNQMFYVRSARALWPPRLESDLSRRATTHRPSRLPART